MNVNRLAVIAALKRLMGVSGQLTPEAEHALVLLAYGVGSYSLVSAIENNDEFKKLAVEMLEEHPDAIDTLKAVETAVGNLAYALEQYLRKQLED